ncbi:NUDIX hydrolase [Nocardioides coralli]|uniref:NUDIX hydrolase n=1 Tax=Nocardioides coralli TaxID=2872154 RepID=UPI001CA44039|nr:NUDIX hydrolase [Nocardioides coralli]QZY28820.1 NUDIX hydrolase [Nocardioides coralli]
MPSARDVVAAGVVTFRPGRQVLLVHRPRYDDWSFPKGKLDRGELAPVAAVREAAEETGLHVRLGPPLASQRYPMGGDRHKVVHYWVAWPVDDHDVSGYRVNDEIDEVVWLPYDQALHRLSYARDRNTLVEAKRLRKRTRALVVLRHAKARSRKGWGRKKDDLARPLISLGHGQASRLVPLLSAYDATRVVSSPAARCVDTVRPYADASGWKVEELDGISEEGASAESVVTAADDLLAGHDSAVICTHRPVLPAVFDALALPDRPLDPGGMVVVHHRKGTVVATEVHERP